MGVLEEHLMEMRKELFKTTEATCDIHDEKLVQHKDYRPFCPVCASERVVEDEKELMEAGTEAAYNHKKRWLKERSLVVDRSLFDMTFDNYKVTDEETAANKEKALDLAREYYKGSTKNGLLAGKFGTGKTHLAMAILNQLNEHKDQRNLFVSADELMRKVKSSIGNNESPFREDRMIELLSKADLLVMDDMGAEVGSVNRNSQAPDYTIRVINGVLNGRTSNPTIFTTNLSRKELETAYDGRIVDRMFKGVSQEDLIIFKRTPSKRTTLNF
jgi:DNA replication protein DnaC